MLSLNLWASSTTVHATYDNFNAGDNDQTQIRGAGSAAKVQLQFRFQQLNPSVVPPTARRYFAFAYDPDLKFALLYGGNADTTVYDDLWKFDPASQSWTQINIQTTKPGKLTGQSMVSIGSNKFLMFGGKDDGGVYHNETWIYDAQNITWDSQSLSVLVSSPGARTNFSMVVDTTTKKVVLFGGTTGQAGLSDTWVYDITQATWSLCSPVTHPSGRSGAAMAFNGAKGLIYLFGGEENSSTRRQDTWTYNVNTNVWTDRSPLSFPSIRRNAAMFYDSRDSRRPMVIFGGADDVNALNDVCYYDPDNNAWTSGIAMSTPSIRQAMVAAYMNNGDKALIFGGYDVGGTDYNDMYYYAYRSTGTFTSYMVEAPFDPGTLLRWQKIRVSPLTQTVNTTIKFQIASSADNSTWSDFQGVDTTSGTFYTFDINGEFSINNSNHNDRRYLKYRAVLTSNQSPNSPDIDAMEITYDRSPSAPSLSSPLQGGTTNAKQPVFAWANSSDLDNDPLTYELQVDNELGFGTPIISSAGIPSGAGGYTAYQSTSTLLDNGTWYWRVCANDSSIDGNWSSIYTLHIDTIAPGAITDLTAQPGPSYGQATLRWTATGNNNSTGTVSNGVYDIRFSTGGEISTDGGFVALADSRTINDSYAPGQQKAFAVSGLANGATYYFALKIRDDAGNYSLISTTSPHAYTDAPPRVYLTSTVVNSSSGTKEISWTSDDPNPGDTRKFTIYVSSDSGATYGLIVTTGLPNGTTSYLWDSRLTGNGGGHRVKVEALDSMGLTGSDFSADFSVSNPNQAPAVTVLYPNGGETLAGTATLRWSMFDFNGADTHSYDVYVSSDGGNVYGWYFAVSTTTYALNTNGLPNGLLYRLKVRATDSGVPAESGEDLSDANFSISNGNLPPNDFSLLLPLDGSSRSRLDMNFAWENRGDPNQEDSVSYTLMYSTSADLAGAVSVTAIREIPYHLAPSLLTEETTYYWKVIARDPLGLEKSGRQTFSVYVLSRFKTSSEDGKVFAQIQNVPDNGFLKIEKVDPAQSRAIQAANKDTKADRHLISLNGSVYRLSVCDINGQPLDVQNPAVSLSMQYTDADGDGYFDGTLVPVGNLRCALLSETQARWEPVSQMPSLDSRNRRIVSALTRLGTITLVGALTPTSRISSVVNYPNPFAAGKEDTRVRYVLNEDSAVEISIYTLLGDLVWEKNYDAGKEGGKGQATGYANEIRWDGRNSAGQLVANGMFLMEIKAGSCKQMRKIGVIK